MKNIKIKIQLKDSDIDIISSQIKIVETRKEKIQLIKETIKNIVLDYVVNIKENSARVENEIKIVEEKEGEEEYYKKHITTD